MRMPYLMSLQCTQRLRVLLPKKPCRRSRNRKRTVRTPLRRRRQPPKGPATLACASFKRDQLQRQKRLAIEAKRGVCRKMRFLRIKYARNQGHRSGGVLIRVSKEILLPLNVHWCSVSSTKMLKTLGTLARDFGLWSSYFAVTESSTGPIKRFKEMTVAHVGGHG